VRAAIDKPEAYKGAACIFPKMPRTRPPAETAAERSIMMRMAVRMAMTMKTQKKVTMAIDCVDVDDDYDGGPDDT